MYFCSWNYFVLFRKLSTKIQVQLLLSMTANRPTRKAKTDAIIKLSQMLTPEAVQLCDQKKNDEDEYIPSYV